MTRAPASRATFSSRELTTSTSGSMPWPRQQATSARSLVCGRMETMSSTVSAPCATASSTWYSSTTKSLRRQTGRRAAAPSAQRCVRVRAARRSSREPLNHFGSVRTESTEAPNFAYSRACSAASRPTLMSPLEGEARLNSAARARPQAEASAAQRLWASDWGRPNSAAKASACASSSAAGFRALASTTSLSRCSTISCSFVRFAAGSP
mmetsp:Transcript_90918/g.294218  ORF Transcript_90918/g.294218 Transcript_90918/m.294218 type:complete len:209 (-) Transcript_90918:91-717(-)